MMTEEQKRERDKAYYVKNREKVLAQAKAYREQNHEKIRAWQKAYRAEHPLLSVWHSMLVRCGINKGASAKNHANYAARGITVCEEWRHFKPFEAWCLANGYKPGLQLDRIDNDGNYCPENCRFVTSTQNNRNRRTTVLAAGIPLATWYDAYKVKMNELGLKYAVVENRFNCKGWTLEDALFTPPKRRSA